MINTAVMIELHQKHQMGSTIKSLSNEYSINRHTTAKILIKLGFRHRPTIIGTGDQQKKYCRLCRKYKLLRKFFINNQNTIHGLSTYCRRCTVRRSMTKVKADPLENQARQWRYRTKLRGGNITTKVTKELLINTLKKQNNCCAICRIPQDQLKKRLSIDHNHKTGKFRGLLCDRCNRVIGDFGEDTKRILRAIYYISGSPEYSPHVGDIKDFSFYRNRKKLTHQICLWNWYYKGVERISIEKYLKQLERQNYCCAICYRTPSEIKRRLAIDHKTDKIRGLLCHHCNQAIGNCNEEICILQNMIKYLEENN